MDDDEREAIRAEGLDPDDPAVVAALDFVSWELSMLGWFRPESRPGVSGAPPYRPGGLR